MDTSEQETSAEKQLRQARGDVAVLSRLVAEAERGGSVPYENVQERMENVRVVLLALSEGRLGSQTSGVAATSSAMWQTSSMHARAAGNQAVTDMQRRLAQQLLAELNLIEVSLQRSRRKALQRQTHISEVEQLLGTMRASGGRDELSSLHHLEDERKSLHYARVRVRAVLDESNSVMKALRDQGGRLEGTGSKVTDVLESIGVANSTILQILRRNRMDAWLVYGGIALTMLIIYYLW
ncbi:putative SNARE protein [Trypanosoma rangeli]|uniref:Putative SNARE protein n=1 Tax=Trypanosoma rangeli TaxID=5698 RepID=A0A3R7K7L0_TRYRA|nr:putative SNARE protein [Trypanosoma rangeli]RNE95424.1 putative SNARE protein [Trypanosoma rangeli]|eukprot:RNE95424.1 putative SNARE protein [Trypanosoma rangeli]